MWRTHKTSPHDGKFCETRITWLKPREVQTKVSRQFFTNCHTWQNTFNLEKKNPTCDIYVLYCLDNDGNYLKTIVIPSVVLQDKTQVGIGKNSKYNKYIDNWNVIEEYRRFYNSMGKRV